MARSLDSDTNLDRTRRSFYRRWRGYIFGIAAGLLLIGGALALMQALAARKSPSFSETSLTLPPRLERAGLSQRPAGAGELGFNLARVNHEGQMVLGGYAPSLSRLVLFSGGKPVGGVLVDERGEWLFLSSEALMTGQHYISLEAEIVEKKEIVYGIETLLVVLPDQTNREESAPLIVVLPNEGGRASRVLSDKFSGEPIAVGTDFSVDVVDYNENGRLTLSGRLRGGNSELLLYRGNGALLARRRFEGKGAVPIPWQMTSWLAHVPENTLSGHKLRIDMVAEGNVVQRRLLPIEWAPLMREGEDTYFVVRPGASLWHIARRVFGTGTLHTFLYEANKAQIQNPDLIHPGQILFIPKGRSEAALEHTKKTQPQQQTEQRP